MGDCYLLIIDGLGVGAQEDADKYGDKGSNTLGHVVAETRCALPEFEKLGLGNIIPLDTVAPVRNPKASFGKMREYSAGKDSTTGHWEIAGLQLDRPFPTYPDGFPEDVIQKFCKLTGNQGVLSNQPASGTAVIEEHGIEHQQTGLPIVYTSADSVFQVACHTDTVSVDRLYEWCAVAREQVMVDQHAVGRVIARPFGGVSGNYYRLSDQRHDYSLEPPEPFLPQYLQQNGIETVSVGKIADLFAERGFSRAIRTKSNTGGLETLLGIMGQQKNAFVFTNLIETDQNFGHRNDADGYAKALEEIDRAIPSFLRAMKDDDILIITGDHGNDPTMPSTDHSREFTPVLIYPASKAHSFELPTRSSFSDIAVSVCDFFGLDSPFPGYSFLSEKE